MDFGHPHTLASSGHADTHRPLCHCLNVTEQEVRDAIAVHDPQSVRGVSQVCGAGGGCMSCHRHIRRLLNERVLLRRSQILSESGTSDAACPSC